MRTKTLLQCGLIFPILIYFFILIFIFDFDVHSGFVNNKNYPWFDFVLIFGVGQYFVFVIFVLYKIRGLSSSVKLIKYFWLLPIKFFPLAVAGWLIFCVDDLLASELNRITGVLLVFSVYYLYLSYAYVAMLQLLVSLGREFNLIKE